MNFKRLVSLFLVFLFVSMSSSVFGQQKNSFPSGSTEGTTGMGSNVSGPLIPNVDLRVTQPQTGQEVAFSVRILLLLTLLSLAPSMLVLVTSFLRFSIVLDFIKRSLSLQQVPPTAVLNGIAFFMTIFVMFPTFKNIYDDAYKPMADGEIGIEQAIKNSESPLRLFMYGQIAGRDGKGKDVKYIAMFMNMANMERPQTLEDVPTYVLIPAYILHELTVAFKIGIMLYIPFIVIDMVVASILMSMGMMMLPPVQISMPFKLMLFILVDGWGLLTQQLFNSVLR
ncbi:MAG: flagellar type III secretion system pore protein FliP [Treponema sp.]|nr:flagellar type III secretion system pore protein FliP [Treponema sp.]